VLSVTALLDLSTDRGPAGAAQRNALQLWVDQQQSRTNPLRVRLRVVDVGPSEARLLVELRRAVQEEQADAVIIGTPVLFYSAAFSLAADVARTPILLTLPAPEPRPESWVFTLAPSPAQLATYALDDASARGALQPALLLTRDEREADAERLGLQAEQAQRGLAPWQVVGGRAEPGIDQVQQIANALAGVRSVHVTGPPARHSGVLDALRRSRARPLFYLSYLAEPAGLGEFRDGAVDAIWPVPRGAIVPSFDARRTFAQPYTDRHGAPPAHAATAYDAIAIVAQAAERGGLDDRDRLRESLRSITVEGAAASYAFSSQDHAGFPPQELAYARWSGTSAVLAPPPMPVLPP
jgi:branched-chain amino acid transport system substrate-binding protein